MRASSSTALALASAPAPIGVFDSGIGGLTVLSALAQALPHENFIYLGDTARVPYGARSAHIIQRYSIEDTEYLLGQKVKLIVIACNTAAAYAEEMLCKRYKEVPFIGVIEPGVDALLKIEERERLGVVGTHSTIKSGVYKKRILSLRKGVEILQRACPLLVPLVEEDWIDKEVARLTIQEYFRDFIEAETEAVILACTHYPLLKERIQKEFPSLCLVDSSQEVAKAVRKLLEERELSFPKTMLEKKRRIRICLTDKNEGNRVYEKFLSFIDPISLEFEEVCL